MPLHGQTMLLTLLACGPAVPDETDTTPVVDGEHAAPTWTAAEVEDRLNEALAMQIPSFPLLSDLWDELISHGDGYCPPSPNGFMMIGGGCTTAEGYLYSGVGGRLSDWHGTNYIFQVQGDMVIVDPAGNGFEVGGADTGILEVLEDKTTLDERFLGSFQYAPWPLWLADGTSGAAWVNATWPKVGEPTIHLEGGYRLGGASVYFADVTTGGDCGAAPTGAVRLRDDDGYWYELDYGTACTGCGALSFDGAPLGDACLDLAPALDTMWVNIQDHLARHSGPP